MTVMHDEEYDLVPPAAGAMIESLRAYGYTLPTAVADLLDNSISAGARNIWIKFHWNGSDSFISILDDGSGMTEEELREAMRPGSKNPLEERPPKDLGRFGLGLKTASFSQCRRLTVASKKEGGSPAFRRWDLDYVQKTDKWHLLRYPAPGSEIRLQPLEVMAQGTLVLWENPDRIVGEVSNSDKSAHDRFLQIIGDVEEHLAMVFHRYLEGPFPRLRIYINGQDDTSRVKPWDTFLSSHPATVTYPREPISTRSGMFYVQGFVLPHKDKLTDELYQYASGPAGWTGQQGFYVYRNDRLLVAGSWLGLGNPRSWTKEEQYKLARISIDIPNSLDMDWQIDVKKSTARPPSFIRKRLRDLAEVVRKQAREVFVHRGTYGPGKTGEPVVRIWRSANKKGRLVYRIDRPHPLVRQVTELSPEHSQLIEVLLRVIEETVPVQQIWLDTAERPEAHSRPFENAEQLEIRRVIEVTYRAMIAKGSITPAEARKRLADMDAFRDYTEIISSLTDIKGGA
jgi:hypothetical protein